MFETTPKKSALLAWDPRAQRAAWRVEQPHFRNGGLLATAGNLVFQGTLDGKLSAYRASTGERRLELPTGTSILAAPATYAIGGTQYIVLMAGYGGSGLATYPEGSAARRYGNDGRIIAFRLDGGPAPLPPEIDWDANLPALPARPELNPQRRARSARLFDEYCSACHQLDDEPGGYPNLLRLHPAKHGIFREIVLGGVFESRGMASFADVIEEEDVRALHDYLIVTAHEVRTSKALPVRTEDSP